MELTATGQRVLGCLVEKQLATPQQYPLSVNALVAACNQRTGRDPVVDWGEDEVRDGLDDLKRAALVKASYATGSRTPRYAHRADEQLDLSLAALSVLALLLLRGPQTLGELRARSERLHAFGALEEVEAALTELQEHRLGPFATELPRRPGQKEARYDHLLGGEPVADSPPPATSLHAEVAALRADLDELRVELQALRRRLDDRIG